MSTPPLPRSYRWALVAAVVVGFQVALAAGFDLQAAFNHDTPPPLAGSEAAVPGLGLSPLAQRQLVLAVASGYQTALEGMLPWRAGTSALLALASGLVFVMGMRLRISQESRPSTAQLLGQAAFAAAVLRSIDGAETLVILRSMLAEAGQALVREGVPDAELFRTVMAPAFSVASAAWTLIVVATFVTLGNYFRSETLRTALDREAP